MGAPVVHVCGRGLGVRVVCACVPVAVIDAKKAIGAMKLDSFARMFFSSPLLLLARHLLRDGGGQMTRDN